MVYQFIYALLNQAILLPITADTQDTKTTIPGVRKYYAANKFERLYKTELIDTLFVILNLWKVVNKGEELEDEFSE